VSDLWACPRCSHALVPYYSRPWRRGLRRTFWRGCVACDYRTRYMPNRAALTVAWPTFTVGVLIMVVMFAVAAYGWGRMLGSW
jgi:hypothetical protein